MTEPQTPAASKPARFSRNDWFYFGSLLLLFAGVAWQYSPALALIVIGALGVGISAVTSFFVTWLSHQAMLRKK